MYGIRRGLIATAAVSLLVVGGCSSETTSTANQGAATEQVSGPSATAETVTASDGTTFENLLGLDEAQAIALQVEIEGDLTGDGEYPKQVSQYEVQLMQHDGWSVYPDPRTGSAPPDSDIARAIMARQ